MILQRLVEHVLYGVYIHCTAIAAPPEWGCSKSLFSPLIPLCLCVCVCVSLSLYLSHSPSLPLSRTRAVSLSLLIIPHLEHQQFSNWYNFQANWPCKRIGSNPSLSFFPTNPPTLFHSIPFTSHSLHSSTLSTHETQPYAKCFVWRVLLLNYWNTQESVKIGEDQPRMGFDVRSEKGAWGSSTLDFAWRRVWCSVKSTFWRGVRKWYVLWSECRATC